MKRVLSRVFSFLLITHSAIPSRSLNPTGKKQEQKLRNFSVHESTDSSGLGQAEG
jgi:hypothetical protein